MASKKSSPQVQQQTGSNPRRRSSKRVSAPLTADYAVFFVTRSPIPVSPVRCFITGAPENNAMVRRYLMLGRFGFLEDFRAGQFGNQRLIEIRKITDAPTFVQLEWSRRELPIYTWAQIAAEAKAAKLLLRMTPRMKRAIEEVAKEQGHSVNEWILAMLSQAVRQFRRHSRRDDLPQDLYEPPELRTSTNSELKSEKDGTMKP